MLYTTLIDIPNPSRQPMEYLVNEMAKRLLREKDQALVALICGAHAEGRVPRYIWHHPHKPELELHSGDTMPTDGPWVVYTITPEAVAYAIGKPQE